MICDPRGAVAGAARSAPGVASVGRRSESNRDRIGALINSRLRVQVEGTLDDMLGQIEGCDGVTTLGFGALANRNVVPKGWVARNFLTESPRIALPKRFLNPAAVHEVEQAMESFSPPDLDAFFKNPSDVILGDYLR